MPELQGRSDIETIVELGTDEIEISLLVNIPGLFDLGIFDDKRAFQRHAFVDLPIVNDECLIANLLYCRVCVGNGSEPSELDRQGITGREQAEFQGRVEDCLRSFDTQFKIL